MGIVGSPWVGRSCWWAWLGLRHDGGLRSEGREDLPRLGNLAVPTPSSSWPSGAGSGGWGSVPWWDVVCGAWLMPGFTLVGYRAGDLQISGLTWTGDRCLGCCYLQLIPTVPVPADSKGILMHNPMK